MRPVLALLRHASTAAAVVPRLFRAPAPPITRRPFTPLRKSERERKDRIASLLRPVKELVQSGRRDSINGHFEGALRNWSAPSKHWAYEASITSLIKYHDFLGACRIYALMRSQGLLPSPTLQRKIILLYAVTQSISEDDIVVIVEEMLQRHQGDKLFHCHVAEILCHTHPFSSKFFLAIRAAYARVNGRRGALSRRAKQLLDDHIKQDSGEPILDQWCQDALEHLGTSHPYFAARFHSLMARYDGNPVLLLGNFHIEAQLNAFRYDTAFQIYDIIKKLPTFTPNSRTFHLLFKAIRMASLPRSFKSRKTRAGSGEIPSARALFREAMQSHYAATAHVNTAPPPRTEYTVRVLTPSALSSAIATFLNARDYAAVYIVIRTFELLAIPLELSIYSLIVEHFIRRVLASLQKGGMDSSDESRWVSTFIGTPPDLPGPAKVLQTVLAFGLPPRDQENMEGKTKKPVVIPSIGTMLGTERPAMETWDPVPLERILKRAVRTSQLVHPPSEFEDSAYASSAPPPIAKLVSLAIASAKAEMIPTLDPISIKERIALKKKPLLKTRRKK